MATRPSTTTEGNTAAFNVYVAGALISYQWQQLIGDDWTDIPGAINASFRLPNVSYSLNGSQYRVVVTNPGGRAYSNRVRLTVRPVPPRPWTATVMGLGTTPGLGTLVQASGAAVPGTVVTLAFYERPGFRLTSLSVSGTGVTPGDVNLEERTIQFTMPAGSANLALTVRPRACSHYLIAI